MKKILILLFTLASCKNQDLNQFKITISYIPNIQFAPLYVGQVKGFFADEGIDLHIDYAMGADIFALLASGKIDAGLADSDQLLIALSKNLDVVAFRQYYRYSPLSIITVNNDITSPSDLAGKKIGVPELFGSSFLALQEFLSFYNLSSSPVIQRIGYNQIAMLEKGDIDAAVTYINNENIFLEHANIDYKEWPISQFSPLAGSALISSRRAFNDNNQLYQRFNRALSRSVAFLREEPEQSLDIAMKVMNAQANQREILHDSMMATISLYSDDGYLPPDSFTYTFNQLKKFNFIDEQATLPKNYLMAESE